MGPAAHHNCLSTIPLPHNQHPTSVSLDWQSDHYFPIIAWCHQLLGDLPKWFNRTMGYYGLLFYWTRVMNSLAPGRCVRNFRSMIFIAQNSSTGTLSQITLRWMPQNFTNEQWTLIRVMAWWCQATSHYQIQCWPRSMLPYGFTGPRWVNPQSTVIPGRSKLSVWNQVSHP